ncbi:MAG: cofactor-independent phosphoglycerate mutase [Candidatus Cloacimonetes bacterium]|nr:cofactor-independent phosphoglycerate mutase [Candidatus Cloacimonadota bacterium]
MKYIIILGDGMSDRPIASRGGKTPLMLANIPHIDELARKGRNGRLITVPADMPPGSEVANLAVLGYDVRKVYQGRGVLEGASMGVEIADTDLAMRCNLICIEGDNIKNHSAGHIHTDEAHVLIDYLNERLADDVISFHRGISYRHLAVVHNGSNDISFTPPHDVPGSPWRDELVKASSTAGQPTADLLNRLIVKSQELLAAHPINLKRIEQGLDPANCAWFWSAGYKPAMKTMGEKYGVTGAVITAVDIIKGLGIYAGMDVIEVQGATGLIDTNYEGKAAAAVAALDNHDLVYLHVEATDEAGHEGDIDLKIKALEYLDSRLVKHIVQQVASLDVAIAVIPDHATPCELRTHTHDAVPFIIYKPGATPDAVAQYNETAAQNGDYGLLEGEEFIKALLGK